jgi:hypothetical protein
MMQSPEKMLTETATFETYVLEYNPINNLI